jgi:nicotinamidase-related amidase
MDMQVGIVERLGDDGPGVVERAAAAVTAAREAGISVIYVREADPEVHRVLNTKVFPPQAEVTTVEEWDSAIKNPQGRDQ